MTNINKKFGNFVREQRTYTGLTQLQLSKLAKIDRTTITRIETTGVGSKLTNVMALLEALGTDLTMFDYFLINYKERMDRVKEFLKERKDGGF